MAKNEKKRKKQKNKMKIFKKNPVKSLPVQKFCVPLPRNFAQI